MVDNIFGDRFLGNRTPAWHSLGTVFTDAPTAEEAIGRCGADIQFTLQPCYAHIDTLFGTQVVEVAGRKFIVRHPTQDDQEYRVTGIASDDYGLVQNIEIGRILDRLTGKWPVETVGVLGKGETLFVTLDAGEAEIRGGEKLHQYFLVADTKNGGTSLKIAFTPVRVVCQNTLVTGLRQATVSAALQHHTGISATLDARVDLVSKMQRALNFTLTTFETMAKAAITNDEFNTIVEATYPHPKRPARMALLDGLDENDISFLGGLYDEATKAQETFLYYCNRADVFRAGAKTLYDRFNGEYPKVAGTTWAAYNAVVESADYRRGADSVPASALFGARAQEKKRAFDAAWAITQSKV